MSLEKLREKVDPLSTKLLVIDMQKDYCCAGGIFDSVGFGIEDNQLLATRLSDFVDKVRPILQSIVFIRMDLNPFLRSAVSAEQYERSGAPKVRDAAYSEFYGVVPGQEDIVIPKYRYSAFVSTYLDQYLKSNEIKTLVLTGVATNVCVESTARDGFMKDYHIVIPADMTEGTSAEAKNMSLFNINTFFGEVVDSADLVSCWGA